MTPEGFFFKTREGYNFGPYQHLTQAKIARRFFISLVKGVNSAQLGEFQGNENNLVLVENITIQPAHQDTDVVQHSSHS